jgi:glycosyltransferase involved in cell wall biosynthesis
MKVLYDHQIFESQNIGGISRYFSELIKYNQTAEISVKHSDNLYLFSHEFKKYNILSNKDYYDKFLTRYNFKGKGRLYRYYNNILKKTPQALSVKYIKKSDFDVFHPTYYSLYFLKYLRKPFVLTVHDMIHENYGHDEKTLFIKKKLILTSNHIIAISKNTKNDIIKHFPEVENKITVVYHGCTFQQLEKINPKERYILFTGLRINYKNFNTFLEAVVPLLFKYDFKLICTGYPFTDKENNLFDSLKIKNNISYIVASENQLIELYSKATAFVFPSLYEGFGIPILEAFASNCPAILSNTSSLPEIGGDAAVYFDPNSIDDMRNQIERVITSSALQNELIKKGKEQVKKFSWEKCAKETMDVYKKI